MKMLWRCAALAVMAGALSACYYEPAYVRSGGGAYIGESAPVYADPYPVYPAYSPGYYPGYDDYYGGGFGVSTIWVDDGYGHRYRRASDGRDGHGRPGGWNGRPGDRHDGATGDRRPPPGGWRGRPNDGHGAGQGRPGGWQGRPGSHGSSQRPGGSGQARPQSGARPSGGNRGTSHGDGNRSDH